MKALTEATHVICQSNHTTFTADEIKALDQATVHRVTMNFLQSYITNEQTPDAKNFVFQPSKA